MLFTCRWWSHWPVSHDVCCDCLSELILLVSFAKSMTLDWELMVGGKLSVEMRKSRGPSIKLWQTSFYNAPVWICAGDFISTSLTNLPSTDHLVWFKNHLVISDTTISQNVPYYFDMLYSSSSAFYLSWNHTAFTFLCTILFICCNHHSLFWCLLPLVCYH